MNLP
jgi:hypothetical protein